MALHVSPVQVVIEPVCDLSLGEGGGCCWKRFLPESVQHQLQALRLPDRWPVAETQRGRLAPDGLCL
jgi:hypothetical protein